MDVRFQCPACHQPIEVDGEWGGAAVACPYCQKTVTAPMASTFEPAAAPPMAQPLGVPASWVSGDDPTIQPGGRNSVAIVGLSLSLAALLSAASLRVVLFTHASEVAEIAEIAEIMESAQSSTKAQARLMEWFDKQGGAPTWFLAICLFLFLGLGTWVAGLICSIVAVRRPFRRNLAWASFGILFVSLVTLFV